MPAPGVASLGADGPATVLWHSIDIEFRHDRTKLHVRRLVRVNFADGLEHSLLHETVGPARKAKGVTGWCGAPGRAWAAVDPASIFEFSPPTAEGIYTDLRILAGGFADARPRALLAWEYEIEDADISHLTQKLAFPLQCGARRVQVRVKCPPGWQVVHEATHPGEWSQRFEGETLVLEGADWPGPPDEALLPPTLPTSRNLVVTCHDPARPLPGHYADWASVGAELFQRFAEPSRPGDLVRSRVRALTSGMTHTPDKVRALAAFVRDDVRYVGIEIGKGRWVPRSAETSLQNRFADCKDKSALLMAMLKEVGVDALPVLVNATSPVLAGVPTPYAFDHCIVAIPATACPSSGKGMEALLGDLLLFDPTDPATPLGALPSYVAGKQVLLAGQAGRLASAGARDWTQRWQTMVADATLGEDGSVRATITIEHTGLLAHEVRQKRAWMSDLEVLRDLRKMLEPALHDLKILDVRFESHADSTRTVVVLESAKAVTRDAQLGAFDPAVVPMPRWPVLRDGPRAAPFFLGEPLFLEARVTWTLPKAWLPRASGDRVEAEIEGNRFVHEMAVSDNRATIDWSLSRAGNVIAPGRVQEVTAFLDVARRTEESPLLFTVQR